MATDDSDRAMTNLLRTVLTVERGYAHLRVMGEVDMATAADLAAAIEKAFATGRPTIVLDLRDVYFFGAAGIGALVAARDTAERRNIDLRLVCTGRTVIRVLTVTCLIDRFAIYADVAAALPAS